MCSGPAGNGPVPEAGVKSLKNIRKKSHPVAGVRFFRHKQGGMIMPGFNGRGPEGQGPASGRMRGMCRRTDYSTFGSLGGGRGMGRGRGLGMGASVPRGRVRAGAGNTPVPNDLDALRQQYDAARETMEQLREEISRMETEPERKSTP